MTSKYIRYFEVNLVKMIKQSSLEQFKQFLFGQNLI